MRLLTQAQVVKLSASIDVADFDREELTLEVEDVYPELDSFQIEQVVGYLLGED